MACIRPDGSLTVVGRTVLKALREQGDREKAALATGLPLYRVRLVARALQEAGLVREEHGRMWLTPLGEEKLPTGTTGDSP